MGNLSLPLKVASLLSIVVALYHVIGIFYPINSSPPWRHFSFTCVSLFCSYGFAKRPKYFIYFFFLLLVQQYYSHGGYLLSQWFDYGKIDWISLVLLLLLPILFYSLLMDRKSQKAAR